MAKTVSELKDIVRLGGGVSIDATITTSDLKELARLASTSGATIVLRNADRKTVSELKGVARLAPSKIIFEF